MSIGNGFEAFPSPLRKEAVLNESKERDASGACWKLEIRKVKLVPLCRISSFQCRISNGAGAARVRSQARRPHCVAPAS